MSWFDLLHSFICGGTTALFVAEPKVAANTALEALQRVAGINTAGKLQVSWSKFIATAHP